MFFVTPNKREGEKERERGFDVQYLRKRHWQRIVLSLESVGRETERETEKKIGNFTKQDRASNRAFLCCLFVTTREKENFESIIQKFFFNF